MKITILGSGTAVPDLTRNSAGVLIEHGEERSLVDLGYGNVHQLLRLGIRHHDIDRIFFTHPHPDHICDLIYFLFAARYKDDPRTRRLEIIAGPGFGTFFAGVEKAFRGWLTPDTYPLEILEVDAGMREFGGLRVGFGPVRHIAMSRAYRFTQADGRSLVVSGDTDYSPELVELARETDLLVLECSFPDDQKVSKHLTPTLCGRMAREAGCQTLCLTHFYPPCRPEDAARTCAREFSGEIVLARDLTTMEL